MTDSASLLRLAVRLSIGETDVIVLGPNAKIFMMCDFSCPHRRECVSADAQVSQASQACWGRLSCAASRTSQLAAMSRGCNLGLRKALCRTVQMPSKAPAAGRRRSQMRLEQMQAW